MTATTQYDVRTQAYSSIILPLARQQHSMLYDKVFVRTNDITGKTFYQDQIGTWKMQAKTAANAATPQNDPNLSRTRIDIATYNDARVLDRSLQLQTLADPASMASICIQSAVGIQIDTVIYNALGAVAYRGEQGASAVSFPAGQVIAKDMEASGTNTGLTLAKIRRAAKMLDAAGVPSDDRTLVASATEKEQLLGDDKVTSGDYNTIRALVRGEIDTFVGFKFVWLPDGIIKVASNIADCFAFHKTGVCFGMLEDLFLRITERDDLSFSKQVYYEMSCGAGRLEEAKVVKIECDQTK